jgi:hypothetical protein
MPIVKHTPRPRDPASLRILVNGLQVAPRPVPPARDPEPRPEPPPEPVLVATVEKPRVRHRRRKAVQSKKAEVVFVPEGWEVAGSTATWPSYARVPRHLLHLLEEE